MARKPCKTCDGEMYIHTEDCKRNKGCLNGGTIYEQGCTCIPRTCDGCGGTGDSRRKRKA